MLLSKDAICDSKKARFMKQQEASGLFSSLGIKASLLFKEHAMNKIANKFLLAGDKCMPEMRLKATRFYMQCLWTIYQKNNYTNV